MQYQVLVQHRPDGLFSATVMGLPDCVVEGATQEEALLHAKTALHDRLTGGEVFTIEVDAPPARAVANPWLETHGSLRDDPTFDNLMEEIANYRRELEAFATT
jgi:hypothetical protein